MGDRVSIQFVNGGEKSVVLFCHWGGMGFVKEVEKYVRELSKEVHGNTTSPLDRMEPGTVMVDFIRYYTEGLKRVESNLYLGFDEMDGDNSDNGHFLVHLDHEDDSITTLGGV